MAAALLSAVPRNLAERRSRLQTFAPALAWCWLRWLPTAKPRSKGFITLTAGMNVSWKSSALSVQILSASTRPVPKHFCRKRSSATLYVTIFRGGVNESLPPPGPLRRVLSMSNTQLLEKIDRSEERRVGKERKYR